MIMVLFAQPDPVSRQGRHALVIGVSNYDSLDVLPNAANDAQLISQSLVDLGFSVANRINLTQDEMERELTRYSKWLRESNARIGLFYFAGHGLQIDNHHYLITKETPNTTDGILEYGVELNGIVDKIAAGGVEVVIVIIDSCRTRLSHKKASPGVLEISSRRLLGAQVLIAFSTSPGGMTFDGLSRYSPYTEELSRLMYKKGLSVEEVFKRTGRRVSARYRGLVVPWQHSSLSEPLYFVMNDTQIRRMLRGSLPARVKSAKYTVIGGAVGAGVGAIMGIVGMALWTSGKNGIEAEIMAQSGTVSPSRQRNIYNATVGPIIGYTGVGAGVLGVAAVICGQVRINRLQRSRVVVRTRHKRWVNMTGIQLRF
ncbi:MAG: caspase family protein [Myxococcota bacterium]